MACSGLGSAEGEAGIRGGGQMPSEGGASPPAGPSTGSGFWCVYLWARALKMRDASYVGADSDSCHFLSVARAKLLGLIQSVIPQP